MQVGLSIRQYFAPLVLSYHLTFQTTKWVTGKINLTGHFIVLDWLEMTEDVILIKFIIKICPIGVLTIFLTTCYVALLVNCVEYNTSTILAFPF